MMKCGQIVGAVMLALVVATAAAQLPGATLAEPAGDLAQRNADQWDAFLLNRIAEAKAQRGERWQRTRVSPDAYAISVKSNRDRLAQSVGVIDSRVADPKLEMLADAGNPWPLAETAAYSIWRVRWPVLDGVDGEGVQLRPKGKRQGFVVLLPDADQEPEVWAGLAQREGVTPAFAQRLAEAGVEVVILALVDRATTNSGDVRAGVMTNQSHREWLYRQAAPAGRHIIGYEIQKVSALIDARVPKGGAPVGVFGYGEGGLVALYAAALDPRIGTAGVSGYFQPRERLWAEPLYREVKGLLNEFGDAEIASLIAPRALLVEAAAGPRVGAPAPRKSGPATKLGASAGTLVPAKESEVSAEFERARALVGDALSKGFRLVAPAAAPGGEAMQAAFAQALGVALKGTAEPIAPGAERVGYAATRQARMVARLGDHVQAAVAASEGVRDATFWSKVKPTSAATWPEQVAPLRQRFTEDFIGSIPLPEAPLRVRSRPMPEFSTEKFSLFEVTFDVMPGIEDWGLLLLPTGLAPGERRPVVVCQHGANSAPADLIASEGQDKRAASIYRRYAARLAERGFVAFAPSMPNHSGGERFQQLARKATPLGLSIFSLVTASQTRLLRWLREQPFVDPSRIAYYGMSYGGKAAMRVPAMLTDFAAVVVAGDFNDYVRKMTHPRADKAGALYNSSPDMIEFDLANRFNHAEMAALIAPRPFMVEGGYQDRVAPADWAAGEYAKVRRLYLRLGVPDRTQYFAFDGPHTVMGTETFAFLHRVLAWPAP
ncbi:MAG: hypothetical protein RIQ93_1631 [Verrucomicrobiota bacterium]|jgi:dienelactone hydrolase